MIMADVFISYARENLAMAESVANALAADGYSVWWDREILAGESFDQVIEHELDQAGCVIVLWSQDSASSEWVRSEAAAAAERGVLVPAFIEQVRLPLEFRRKHTLDLTSWNGDRNAPELAPLRRALEARLRGDEAGRKAEVEKEGAGERWPRISLLLATLLILSVALWAFLATPATHRSNSGELLAQANKLFDQHKWQEAKQVYIRYLDLDPRDTSALSDLGVCYRELGDFETALTTFDRALDIKADSWQALYNKIIVVGFDQNHLDHAKELLKRLRELQANNPDVERLAEALAKREETAEKGSVPPARSPS